MSQINNESVKGAEAPRPDGQRARIGDIPAIGEVLDEQGLRMVAGGASTIEIDYDGTTNGGQDALV